MLYNYAAYFLEQSSHQVHACEEAASSLDLGAVDGAKTLFQRIVPESKPRPIKTRGKKHNYEGYVCQIIRLLNQTTELICAI